MSNTHSMGEAKIKIFTTLVKYVKFASTFFLQYMEANLTTFTYVINCYFCFPVLYIWNPPPPYKCMQNIGHLFSSHGQQNVIKDFQVLRFVLLLLECF